MTTRVGIRGVLLAPGAGAGADQPALVQLDTAIGGLGLAVKRIDFPYRLDGRRRPDPPAVLEAAVHKQAEALAHCVGSTTDALVLGGRSMGGRICSQVVAQGLHAAGLVLVSYPLHPPGRPDRLRTAHFGAIGVPCLFVSGTRDAFGSPDELQQAADLIPGPVTLAWIEKGDHGLRRHDLTVTRLVTDWLATTFAHGA